MYLIRDRTGKLIATAAESPEKHETILELRAMLLETELDAEGYLPAAEALARLETETNGG